MIKKLFSVAFVAWVLLSSIFISEVKAQSGNWQSPDMHWWQEARFGMFVHWGVYSLAGRGEWLMYQEHIPYQEYKKLAGQFNPKNFKPKEWVALAKEAGMKYIVLTTRHHDGFCLFDSKVSDFTAPKTAAKRDLIREFADACHEAGMRMGFYYSLQDWHIPGTLPQGYVVADSTMNRLVAQAKSQVRELLSNYGKVDILWFDGLTPGDPNRWHSQELLDMARELQPQIIINDRSGLPADFSTPENVVVAQKRPWESCFTMNRSWGYAPGDQNYKPVAEVLRVLVSCASQGGNFLLNVSPDGDGKIPGQQIDALKKMGAWMKVNGKAIYGASAAPIVAYNLGLTASVENKVYLFVQRWPGSTVPLAWIGSKVKSARLLSNDQTAKIEQKGDRVWLHGFPQEAPDPYLPVIELTFDGQAKPSVPAYK